VRGGENHRTRRQLLVRAGLVELIGEERMYMTLPTAVAAYREWVAAES
jgi:hypothetical protein